MFSHDLFTLVSRLLSSRWSRDRHEQHTAWEESLFARIGPIRLESNDAFVLDHADVYVGLHLPILCRNNGRWQWHTFQLGYRDCRGDEQVRQSGFEISCIRPFSECAAVRKAFVDEIPF